MQQLIIQSRYSGEVGEQLVSELQRLDSEYVIIHVSSFYDHVEEKFKAIILYHI